MTASYYAFEYTEHADILAPGCRTYRVIKFHRLVERENWVRQSAASHLMRGWRQRLLAGDPLIEQARQRGLLISHGEK